MRRRGTNPDTENIKYKLWSVVYGIWNYIKNSGKYPETANLTLEWVGLFPGKRESRRFVGYTMLTQQDVIEQRSKYDTVAFGGWSIDLHPADGVFSTLSNACNQWHSKGVYPIPYRCYLTKDIDNLYLHHILHSLGIAKAIEFTDGTTILDVGTGGGFPGIPLAILFPECRFHLIDRVGKKIKVAQSVAEAIGLTNVTFQHGSVEEHKDEYDFVVSRAVMPLPDLLKLVRKNIRKEQHNALPNGLLCLKGGDLQSEIAPVKKTSIVFNLSDYFKEEYFETKKVIYVQIVKK